MVTKKVARPRRSPSKPQVAIPKGPNAHEIKLLEDLHPEAMEYVDIASKALLAYRMKERPPIPAEYIVAGFIDHVAHAGWLEWKTMLNVVRDIGLADPRYYGVADPVAEMSCVKCLRVLPHAAFEDTKVRCRKCEERDADV